MYFIFDCNGKVVGNPKGYATFKGAYRQQNLKGSPAYNAIWAAFNAKNIVLSGTLICSIKEL